MRARNVKPSLFKNEFLATSDPLNTLIFEGLWCMADRAGRLEDRPRRIHLEINAGRAYEGTEAALAWLAEHAFIIRYEVGGERYIQIVNFAKHQHPHHKEPESKIPGPGAGLMRVRGEPESSPVQAPDEPESSPSDSGFLIPDSSTPDGVEARARARRPTKRCPPDFELTEQLRAWAADKFPQVDVDAQTEAFRDYEFAHSRRDWEATWRGWIRKAAEFNGASKGAGETRRKTRYEQAMEALERGG